jgi:alkylhydroperoxidase family enzyme
VARIPLVDPDDPTTDPKAASILAAVREQFGTDFNVIRALANHPDALESFMGLQAEVYTSKRLTPEQTEIAYYTAAVANSCHY